MQPPISWYYWLYSKSVLSTFSVHINHLGILWKCRSWFSNLEKSLRFCISNKLPGAAEAADVKTTFRIAFSISPCSRPGCPTNGICWMILFIPWGRQIRLVKAKPPGQSAPVYVCVTDKYQYFLTCAVIWEALHYLNKYFSYWVLVNYWPIQVFFLGCFICSRKNFKYSWNKLRELKIAIINLHVTKSTLIIRA